MDTWTTQSGYPVVEVSIRETDVSLTQKRFFIRNLNDKPNETNGVWSIPLTWTTGSERNFQSTEPKYWFKLGKDNINMRKNVDDWIVFNIQQSGTLQNETVEYIYLETVLEDMRAHYH